MRYTSSAPQSLAQPALWSRMRSSSTADVVLFIQRRVRAEPVPTTTDGWSTVTPSAAMRSRAGPVAPRSPEAPSTMTSYDAYGSWWMRNQSWSALLPSEARSPSSRVPWVSSASTASGNATVSSSSAVLFARSGSTTDAGGVTVAVFTSEAAGLGPTVTVML